MVRYLDLQESFQGEVAILGLIGKMMGGPETQEVHDRIKNFLSKGHKKVIIDLEHLKWLNSAGIGALIACLSSISRENGRLKLANLSGKDQSVFFTTKLIHVFEHHKSVAEAVTAFG